MSGKISNSMVPAAMLLVVSLILSYWLMTRNSTAYSASAPTVTTLSAITEGATTPVRVAADQSGNLYVTDPRSGGVLKYNSAGNLLQKITTTGKNLMGVAITKNGDILVSQGTVVADYSPTGTYKKSFGVFGMANGIAVDPTGTVFVTDSKLNNVQVFNPDLTPRSTFGTAGVATGQFRQPTGISFEKVAGQLAVVDTLNGRVQFFTPDGAFQKTLGSSGAGPLKFTSPQAVAFEYSADGKTLSRIYVLDSFQANVQVIDGATFEFLRYIGSYGLHSGQMANPGDVVLDAFNRLIIPNGTGVLALFGVGNGATAGGATGGLATSFTPPSTGATPPDLTLDPPVSLTRLRTQRLTGTVTVGASVSVNGAPALVDPNGGWGLPVALTQQGLNNFIITASKDNSTSAISTYITLDSEPPVITDSILPQTGSTTSTPVQTVSGAVSDTTPTVATVVVNGVPKPTPVNDGLFSTAIVLDSGINNISIAVTDAAGNTSQVLSGKVTYNPLAPLITLSTPGDAVTGNASYTVTGTAPLNSQVSVNGVSAVMSGIRWSATIPLQTGLNAITITAGVTGNPFLSTVTSSVIYAPGQPALAITSPPVDSATANATTVITGTANREALITATLNGTNLPVITTTDGSYKLAPAPFPAANTYTFNVTAIDTNGKISTTARSIIYDPTPPNLTVVDATPATIKVGSANGVIIAKDKNGLIQTPNNSNGTALLDLGNANFDPASLNIYALTAAGISSRNGDINGDGKVDIADALLAMQISLGIVPAATFEQLLRGDVAPLVNHIPTPDGKIRLDDAILILQKAIGIEW